MTVINSIDTISLTGGKKVSSKGKLTEEEKKEAAKKAVEGGGAVAATSSALSAGRKSGVDMFTKANRVSHELNRGSESLRAANVTLKKTTGLWNKCKNAYSSAKNSIIEWGKTAKTWKFVKPLLESRAFRFAAGFLGYGFGIVTLITGLGDVANTAVDAVNKWEAKDK